MSIGFLSRHRGLVNSSTNAGKTPARWLHLALLIFYA